MHLPTARAKQRIRDHYDRAHAPTPREEAIRWLRGELAASRAGLDPYDRTILILDPLEHEFVWARAVIEMTGLHLSECRGEYRCIVETDVYDRLGLAADNAPLADVPLASRSADSPTALMEAVFGSLPADADPRGPVPVGFDDWYREKHGCEPPARPALTLLESADDKVVH